MGFPLRVVYYLDHSQNNGGTGSIWPGVGSDTCDAAGITRAYYPRMCNVNTKIVPTFRGVQGTFPEACSFCSANPGGDLYSSNTPGGDFRYADVNLHFWLNCRQLPTQSHSSPPINIDGYTVSEMIPTIFGNVYVDPCGGEPYQQWPNDTPGSEGYNYYTYGLVPMMDAPEAAGKTFLHYVADPANLPPAISGGGGGIGADGSVLLWFRKPIDNILYWARQQGRLSRLAFLFEVYRGATGTAIGRLLSELSPANPGSTGAIFTFQTQGGFFGYTDAMNAFKAACPAANRPDWVMMYSWKTVSDSNVQTFNTDLQAWH